MARFDREHYNEPIALYDVDHTMTEKIVDNERPILGVARAVSQKDKQGWVQ